ncbi:hypothetical protein [Paracoccus rhizosphaerae]|uniref:SnoaL-like domain-containing protein n=1 Tax=Paracoccus rhizosphaerae TaxID=1133347 RepID=A0ABV6CMJ8_9RHOB|nr:hypothetical protein [Paracoccus rhizosphaerae]
MTRQITLAALAFLLVPPMAHAQDDAAQVAPYLDDRSTPERVVSSLYNAIDRKEYLRAHSYYASDAAPEFEPFRDGYANTESVRLRSGEVLSEGAAGTIHSAVPVAIEATTGDGVTVYAGCYRLSQVQPAAQELPPFRPIQITEGTLEETTHSFDEAMGTCSE